MLKEHLALLHLNRRDPDDPMCLDLVDQHGEPFDAVSYAHFKYGLVDPGRDYGYGLAKLIQNDPRLIESGRPTIIVSAPYKYLPTASDVIARALLQALSLSFTERGLEPPELVLFAKTQVGSAAYASATEEERLAELAELGLRIDPATVRGANVLVVDDIRITGTAELKTAEYIEPMGPHSVWYLHAARMASGIPSAVENHLNQSYSHNLVTIARHVNEGRFALNSRVLRLILEQHEQNNTDFWAFIETVPAPFLDELLIGTVGRGLKYIDNYTDALKAIKGMAACRGLPVGRLTVASTAR